MLLVIVWYLTLLHSERPKLYAVMAFLIAIGLMPNKLKSDGLCVFFPGYPILSDLVP